MEGRRARMWGKGALGCHLVTDLGCGYTADG